VLLLASKSKPKGEKPALGKVASKLYDEYTTWLDSGVETAMLGMELPSKFSLGISIHCVAL